MGPTGASCKVPSVFLLDPNALSLYQEGARGLHSAARVWPTDAAGGHGHQPVLVPFQRALLLPGVGLRGAAEA